MQYSDAFPTDGKDHRQHALTILQELAHECTDSRIRFSELLENFNEDLRMSVRLAVRMYHPYPLEGHWINSGTPWVKRISENRDSIIAHTTHILDALRKSKVLRAMPQAEKAALRIQVEVPFPFLLCKKLLANNILSLANLIEIDLTECSYLDEADKIVVECYIRLYQIKPVESALEVIELDAPIVALELTYRVQHQLESIGVFLVRDLIARTEDSLRKESINRMSASQIKEVLATHGLKLAEVDSSRN